MRFIQFRSAPAQKAEPAPASTITRMVSSFSISRNAFVKSEIKTSSKALRTSGRFSVTMATVLRFSTIRLSDMVFSGDAGFDDDFGLDRIGDVAALVRLFMQLHMVFGRGRGAREAHGRAQRHARHRLLAHG